VIYQRTLTRSIHSVCGSLYFQAVSITSISLPMPERASTVQAIEHRKSEDPTLGKCRHARHCSYSNKTLIILGWKTLSTTRKTHSLPDHRQGTRQEVSPRKEKSMSQ
jgi:hypothetical protein